MYKTTNESYSFFHVDQAQVLVFVFLLSLLSSMYNFFRRFSSPSTHTFNYLSYFFFFFIIIPGIIFIYTTSSVTHIKTIHHTKNFDALYLFDALGGRSARPPLGPALYVMYKCVLVWYLLIYNNIVSGYIGVQIGALLK